ncbi:MAG: type II toxin-antitoxin system VapC family toxin [Candidatus Binatia bacterium]
MVRFWDTSAVVALLVDEPESARARLLVGEDPAIIAWWATRTECMSALARLRREETINEQGEIRTRKLLLQLVAQWSEVSPGTRLRSRAERLLSVHPLRAADAYQLAAALVWTRGRTTERGFVSFDDRLRKAAAREGFSVLPADASA